MSARLWRELGISSPTLELNSIGTSEARTGYKKVLVEYFGKHRERLDEDSLRRLERNPLRILDSKNPAMRELDRRRAAAFRLSGRRVARALRPSAVAARRYRCAVQAEPAPRAWARLLLAYRFRVGDRPPRCPERGLLGRPLRRARRAARRACDAGRRLGARYRADRRLDAGRGCAGGRRTARWLSRHDSRRRTPASASSLPKRCVPQAPELRLSFGGPASGFKSQLRRADKSGARFALIVGEAELAAGKISLKALREDKPQELLTVEECVDRLRRTPTSA